MAPKLDICQYGWLWPIIPTPCIGDRPKEIIPLAAACTSLGIKVNTFNNGVLAF